MAQELQMRRGTSAMLDVNAGAFSEVMVDTQTKELRTFDGVTPGGFALKRRPYATIYDMITGAEDRGEGSQHETHDGHVFTQAAEDATDHHATFNGIKFYIADDDASADAVGAIDAEDPTNRHLAAPALVTSLQQRRRYGVTLRELLGRKYNGDETEGTPYDGSATLNGFMPDLTDSGIGITDPDNIAVACETALIFPRHTHFHVGQRTRLLKRSNISRLATRDKAQDNRDEAATISGIAGGYLTVTSTVLGGMTKPPAVGDLINLRRCGGTYRYIQGALVEITGVAGNTFTTDFYCHEDVAATVCWAIFADWTDDVHLSGGIWGNMGDFTFGGHLFEFFGRNWSVKNAMLLGFSPGGGGLGFLFAGDNCVIDKVWAFSLAYNNSGTGAFRCVGGRGNRITTSYGKCGDDALQFVCNTNPTAFEYDWDILDSRYINCIGESTHARSLITSIDGDQQLYDCMARIHDTGHVDCTGKGAKTSVRISNGEGQGYYGQMDRIFMKRCKVNGREASQDQQSYMMQIYSYNENGIGTVYLDHLNLIQNVRKIGLDVRAKGAHIIAADCRIEGEQEAIAFNSDNTVLELHGGEYATLNRGGGGNPNHVVNQYGANTLVLRRKPRFQNIAANKAAVRVSANAVLRAPEGLIANRNANSYIEILGISQSNPAVVTLPEGHGIVNGQEVIFNAVVGMVEINGVIGSASGVTSTTINISGLNSTGFTPYDSGGVLYSQMAVTIVSTPTPAKFVELGDIEGNVPTKTYGTPTLERRFGISFATNDELLDKTSAINTLFKDRGVQVQDTTYSVRYTSEGPFDTSNWQASDGSADLAPVAP